MGAEKFVGTMAFPIRVETNLTQKITATLARVCRIVWSPAPSYSAQAKTVRDYCTVFFNGIFCRLCHYSALLISSFLWIHTAQIFKKMIVLKITSENDVNKYRNNTKISRILFFYLNIVYFYLCSESYSRPMIKIHSFRIFNDKYQNIWERNVNKNFVMFVIIGQTPKYFVIDMWKFIHFQSGQKKIHFYDIYEWCWSVRINAKLALKKFYLTKQK